jgi:hypothetical protein
MKNSETKYLKYLVFIFIFLSTTKPACSSNDVGYSFGVYLFENIPVGNCSQEKPFEMKPINKDISTPISSNLKDYNRQKVFIEFLEKRYWGKSYSTETTECRVERLEKLVFGKEQAGNVNERYYKLIERIPTNGGI